MDSLDSGTYEVIPFNYDHIGWIFFSSLSFFFFFTSATQFAARRAGFVYIVVTLGMLVGVRCFCGWCVVGVWVVCLCWFSRVFVFGGLCVRMCVCVCVLCVWCGTCARRWSCRFHQWRRCPFRPCSWLPPAQPRVCVCVCVCMRERERERPTCNCWLDRTRTLRIL